MILKLWTIPDKPPTEADCFVVLSYAVVDAKRPTAPTRVAIEAAYVWWRKFPKAYVIMSTGDNQGLGVSNAQVMAEYGSSIGIPAEQIILEDQSVNTYENLVFSKAIIDDCGLKNPTIVAYDLHMKRAKATWEKLGWDVSGWVSATGPGESAYGWKAIQTHSRLTIVVYDILAMVWSRVKGWV